MTNENERKEYARERRIAQENENETCRFKLEEHQEFVRDKLEEAARAIIARKDQSPYDILVGACFLDAVLKLPEVSDHEYISMFWETRHDESFGKVTFTFGEEEMMLEVCEGFKGPYGWDVEENTKWRANERFTDGIDDCTLENYLSDFCDMVQGSQTMAGFTAENAVIAESLSCESKARDWFVFFED